MMEGAALAEIMEYQDRLVEPRRKGLPTAAAAATEGNGTMAEQQLRQQVQQLQQRSKELEQEKQQLQKHLVQAQAMAHRELQAANMKGAMLQQQVQELQQQVRKIINLDCIYQ